MPSSSFRKTRRWWKAGAIVTALLVAACVIPAQALVAIHSHGARATPPDPGPASSVPAAPAAALSPSEAAPTPVPGPTPAAPTASSVPTPAEAPAHAQAVPLTRRVAQFGHRLAQLDKQLGDRLFPSSRFIRLDHEISLQESLDKLGYTVNVPTTYAGKAVYQWSDGYRTSTRSDALTTGQFTASGSVTLKTLGEQAALAPNTSFGLANDEGKETTVLGASGAYGGMWLDPDGARSQTQSASGSVKLFASVNDPSGAFGSGVYLTASTEHPDGPNRLMVLPATTGGSWVDEGGGTGHWEGGADQGGYLLCLEDWTDNDYQDDIVLAQGIRPAG